MRSGSSQASRTWAAEPALIVNCVPTGIVSRSPDGRSAAAAHTRRSPCRRNSWADSPVMSRSRLSTGPAVANEKYPTVAELEERIETMPTRRGVGNLFAARNGNVKRLPAMPEWIEPSVASRHAFPPFSEAIRIVHNPTDAIDIDPRSVARRRLAYDELLAGQLALALSRKRIKKAKGRPLPGTGRITRRPTAGALISPLTF